MAEASSISKDLPASLPELVATKYKSAKASQDLVFAPSELAIIHTQANIPFQLRFCPSLAKKPTPQNEQTSSKSSSTSDESTKVQIKPKKNPFIDPEPALFIIDLPVKAPSHFLVLNKFPIISEHFILATKEKKEQSAWLEYDDIAVTYAVLREWERTSKEPGTNKLFAFFNCGNESGASQSHRHLQFLPNASMKEGMEVSDSGSADWENLTNTIAEQGLKGTLPGLPFEYFGGAIPLEADDYNLYQVYKSLIKKAGDALAEHTFSYNLSMTTSAMILVPRRHDKYPVLTGEGYPPGFPDGEWKGWELALNGTILAGTLMVKDKDLYEYLKTDKGQAFDRVLARVCFPFKYSNKGQEVEKSEPTKL